MKFITLLPILAIAVAYEDVDDNYYNTLVKNKEAFKVLMNCVVDIGPCDDFGAHIKSHVIEILKDGCKECDERQKHTTHALIKILKDELPESYDQFEAKYDPSRNLLAAADENIKTY